MILLSGRETGPPLGSVHLDAIRTWMPELIFTLMGILLLPPFHVSFVQESSRSWKMQASGVLGGT